MNIEEFVKQITELKPTNEETAGLNYPEGLLERWLKEFEVKKTSATVYDDPIITLVKSYDISALNVNDITFDSGQLFEDDQYICFGWDATGDRIAIHKLSGKIVAYDVYGARITFSCAENSEKFLEALVELMSFVREKILNNYEEDQRDKRSAEVAYVASLKAGGEEYEDYYKSVLWVE